MSVECPPQDRAVQMLLECGLKEEHARCNGWRVRAVLRGCLPARRRKRFGKEKEKVWEQGPASFGRSAGSQLLLFIPLCSSSTCMLGSDSRLQHGEPPAGSRELCGLFPQPTTTSQGTTGL